MWYKVNKRFIGTQQVRPYRYEYSYDFRNKTSTQVTNDGWELTRWTLSLNSNGLYWTSSSWNELYIQLPKMNTALANAKKITMTLLGKHWNSWDSGNSFFTAQWKYPNASKRTWVYCNFGSANQYYYWGSTIYFTHTQSISWGVCEYNYVVDLVWKTATLTFIQWSTNTYTHSISDSDITNIRANNYIRAAALGTNDAISKINILIE